MEIAPYKILSIQVDGGSEFMADFETACEQMKIPLIVLPPARPKYNGGVERGNRTFREEFYDCCDLIADSIGAMRFERNWGNLAGFGKAPIPCQQGRPFCNE